MTWHYRLPQQFPAMFITCVRSAVKSLHTQIPLMASVKKSDLDAIAEQFRYLRWCVRKEPEAHSEFFHLLNTYDIRTIIRGYEEGGYIIYVTAKPTQLSEFLRLNPELAHEILPQCQ